MKKTENNYSAVKARQSRKTRKSRRSYSPSQLLSGLNKAINIEIDTPEQSEYDDPGLTKFIELSDLVWAKKDAKLKQTDDAKQINLNIPNKNSKIPERSSSNRESRTQQPTLDIRRSNSANSKPDLKEKIKYDNLKIVNEVRKKPSKNEKIKPKLQVPRLYANQPQKIEQPLPILTEPKSSDQKEKIELSKEYKILVKKFKTYLIIFTICIVLLVIVGIVLSIVLSIVINNSCLVKKCPTNLTDYEKYLFKSSSTFKIQSSSVTVSLNSTIREQSTTQQTVPITSMATTQSRVDKICDYGFSGINCEDECGKRFVEPNVKIVGGIEAVPKSWPWTALIYFKYRIEGSGTIVVYYCGGTLIDRVTVLTAAHCIFDRILYENKQIDVVTNKFFPTKESMFKVYLGVHDRTMIDFTQNIEPAIAVNVAKIIKHENYIPEHELNDISILKLERHVDLNEHIQIACLPKTGEKYPSGTVSAWVMGWGALTYGGQASFKLRNVKLTVYEENLCSNVIRNYVKNWNSQICAGDIGGGKDACQGDSGNGLFVTDLVNNKLKYIAAGIVSYGEGCGFVNKPGVYTRISYFLDWIKKHSG